MLRRFMIFLGAVCLGFSAQNFWQFYQGERPLDLYMGVFSGVVGIFVVGVNVSN